MFAIRSQQAHGLVFEQGEDGSWRCFIAKDGDGDGILRRDIQRRVDPIVSEVIFFEAGAAGLGILRSEFVPDPSGRGRLRGNLRDPVRAGRGDIITFTRRGTATPSSLYFTDYSSRMRVLRVYGSYDTIYGSAPSGTTGGKSRFVPTSTINIRTTAIRKRASVFILVYPSIPAAAQSIRSSRLIPSVDSDESVTDSCPAVGGTGSYP